MRLGVGLTHSQGETVMNIGIQGISTRISALRQTRTTRGFTLLELLIVVAILAVLVALALPFYLDYIAQSKVVGANSDVKTFCKALAQYDQMEATMFAGTNLLSIIGKYLPDYRIVAGQTMPKDPWGNDYFMDVKNGVVWSAGPNGKTEGNYTDPAAVAPALLFTRIAVGDDVLGQWKPGFFISDAKAVSPTSLDIFFSRKIGTLVAAKVGVSDAGAPALSNEIADSLRKINDYQYRFQLLKTMTGAVVVTVAEATAQDGRVGIYNGGTPLQANLATTNYWDENPNQSTWKGKFEFTAP
jgi:prepilin-type N-terminal cleavage/methylation domain-containing protein